MKKARNQAADFSAYVALRVAIATLQSLPLSVCDRVAWVLAWLFGGVLGFRRKVVEENLRQALPDASDDERRRVARRMWRHLFLMVAEIAHAPRKVHRTNWRTTCDIPDVERLVRTLNSDRPSVIISGHYGNFELGGYLLGLFGFPTHTVARPLDNQRVDRFVNEFRGRTGQHILARDGSRDEIERVLARGGVFTLLGDQAAGSKGVWVDFFGRPASTHKAVALFSLGYEAPTLVLGSRRTGGPLRYAVQLIDVTDPLADDFSLGDPTSFTTWYTEGLEQLIRVAPEQYWWVHRRWKGEPRRRRRKKLTAEQEALAN